MRGRDLGTCRDRDTCLPLFAGTERIGTAQSGRIALWVLNNAVAWARRRREPQIAI